MTRRSVVLVTAASFALLAGIGGCGKGGVAQPSGTLVNQTAKDKPCVEATDIPVATTPPGTDATGGSTPPVTLDKPPVSMPLGPPPAELKITDLKVGDGPEVKEGDTLTAHYIGVSCSTGKQFDSSWDSGQPVPFPLKVAAAGEKGVIAGWVEGLKGMKVGGRRHLVVPPEKGYGKSGQGADIAPYETLVFVVDAIKTETPPPTTTTTAAPPGSAASDGTAPGSTAVAAPGPTEAPK